MTELSGPMFWTVGCVQRCPSLPLLGCLGKPIQATSQEDLNTDWKVVGAGHQHCTLILLRVSLLLLCSVTLWLQSTDTMSHPSSSLPSICGRCKGRWYGVEKAGRHWCWDGVCGM